MRTSPRPVSTTQSDSKVAQGSLRSSRQSTAVRRISVNALLPLSTALLFALSSASPGTAEVTELDALRVELAQARAEVAALRESATERIREYEEESARLAELTGEREAADSRAEAAGE